jgi:hypothetical protein
MKQPEGKDAEGLEQRLRKWYDSDIAGFVKEYNRLRALEEGKAEQADAKADFGPPGFDPGMKKARDLLKEVRDKTGPSLIDDYVREEQEAIAEHFEVLAAHPRDKKELWSPAKVAEWVRARIRHFRPKESSAEDFR